MSTQYYINQFTKFNNNNGKYVRTWNWAAFLFGPFWYFYQGIWIKGILYSIVSILIIVPFSFLGSLALGLYYGFFGNWDYYLKEKGILLWPFTTKILMLLKPKSNKMNIYQRIVLILGAVALIIVILTAPKIVHIGRGIYVKFDPANPTFHAPMIDQKTVLWRSVSVVGVTLFVFFALKSKKKNKD